MELLCFLLLAFVGGAAGLGVFLYHLSKGHFEEIEDVKYQIFRDEE